MAFFKFRKGGEEHAAQPAPPESVEAMRKRALYRLIGSAVLVLAGVIGFPMLFDSQPRPISVDIPIEIPDKNKTRPLALPSAGQVAPAPTVAPAPMPATPVAAAPTRAPAAMVIEPKEAAISPKVEEKVTIAPLKPPPEPKPVVNSGDGAKALALLEGKAAEKPAVTGEGRFVVQVGAFSDATRAKEARTKLERAGLKTYTQVVETKEGSRTRVRVGPFSDRSDADNAAQKIKTLDLPAAILTL